MVGLKIFFGKKTKRKSKKQKTGDKKIFYAITEPASVDGGMVLSHSDCWSTAAAPQLAVAREWSCDSFFSCKFALMFDMALARPTGMGSAVTSWGTRVSSSACNAKSVGMTVLRPACAAHKEERFSNNSTDSSVLRFISIRVSRLHLYLGRMARTSFLKGDSFKPRLAALGVLGLDGVSTGLLVVTIVWKLFWCDCSNSTTGGYWVTIVTTEG